MSRADTHDITALPPLAPESRLLIVFPTKHLGNFLIALEPIRRALALAPSTRILIDTRYLCIARAAGIESACEPYPRAALERASPLRRIGGYALFLHRLRRRRFDVALDIEGDSVAVNVIRMCRAAVRLGCGTIKHPHLYDRVIPMALGADRPHRWHGYASAFAALGVEPGVPGYPALTAPPDADRAIVDALPPATVVLHAGATKQYKLWPPEHFATLVDGLRDQGRAPVLIGAGATDRAANAAINARLRAPVTDLCDRLSLGGLMALLARATLYVGNDSGPMHLAAAMGIRTLGLFGPTDVDMWRPLGTQARVVRSVEDCPAGCHRLACTHDYRCMRTLTPAQVLEAAARAD